MRDMYGKILMIFVLDKADSFRGVGFIFSYYKKIKPHAGAGLENAILPLVSRGIMNSIDDGIIYDIGGWMGHERENRRGNRESA